MISRREVLVRGGSGIAAMSFGSIAWSAATPPFSAPLSPALFVLDETLDRAGEAIDLIRRADIPLAAFAGDFGPTWLERLEPLWRHGPRPVAGITHGGSFFCIERLGRDHGMICAFSSGTKALDKEPSAAAEAAVAALVQPGTVQLSIGRTAGERDDQPLAWALVPSASRSVHGRARTNG